MAGPKSRLAKYLVGDDYQRIGDKPGGTFGGGLYESPDGEEWYFKEAPSEDHAKNEVLAAKLYRETGVDIPDVELVNLPGGGVGVASKKVQVDRIDPDTARDLPGVRQGFAADAWLGNWDVAGLEFDNIYESGGRAMRIDTGGALRYRAQGEPKGRLWGDEPGELDTLRDPDMGPQASRLFQDIPDEQITEGSRSIQNIPEDRIRELVDQYGPDEGKEELTDTLLSRRQGIKTRYGGTATPGVLATAGAAAAGAGYAQTQSGNIRRQNRERLRQERETEEARREMFSLDERPGIYGPEHPRIAAGIDAVKNLPLGEYYPFVDMVEKLAWGDELTGMDYGIAALDATDFIPGAAALKLAGLFTPAKTEALERGIKAGLKDSGKFDNVSDDLVQDYMDQIEAKYGMDDVANLDPGELELFGQEAGQYGPNSSIVEGGWDFSVGGHVGDFDQLSEMTDQYESGLITKAEYNEFTNDLREKYKNDSSITIPFNASPEDINEGLDDVSQTITPHHATREQSDQVIDNMAATPSGQLAPGTLGKLADESPVKKVDQIKHEMKKHHLYGEDAQEELDYAAEWMDIQGIKPEEAVNYWMTELSPSQKVNITKGLPENFTIGGTVDEAQPVGTKVSGSKLEDALKGGLGKPGYEPGMTVAPWSGKEVKEKYWGELMDKHGLNEMDTLDMVALDLGPGIYGLGSGTMDELAEALKSPKYKDKLDQIAKKGEDAYVKGVNLGMPWVNKVTDFPLPEWYDTTKLSTGVSGTGLEDARAFREEAESLGLGTDAQSRMQRAMDQGYQDIGTHHTSAEVDFPSFRQNPRRGTAAYANVDPVSAEEASQATTMLGNPSRHIPLMFKGKIFGRDRPPDWFLPDEIRPDDIGAMSIQVPEDLKSMEDQIKELWQRSAAPLYDEDPNTGMWRYQHAGRNTTPNRNINLSPGEREEGSWIQPVDWGSLEETTHYDAEGNKRFPIYEAIRAMGYEGWQVADEGGYSVATANPERLRSRFAQFLPERSAEGSNPTGNILAGVGLTAVSLPALMSQLTDIDEDDLREEGFGY